LLPKYVTAYEDLVTSHTATRDGFLEQAVHKTTEAGTYVAEAEKLAAALRKVEDPRALVANHAIRDQLVTAAGFSDKAVNYFSEAELREALVKVIERIEAEAHTNWREEIVSRFLLTRGDSLGGTMRNWIGRQAASKFVKVLFSVLGSMKVKYRVDKSAGKSEKVRSVMWPNRVLLFDRTPKFIGKNIDVILLRDLYHSKDFSHLLASKDDYVVCGELKGGIDPAGADEHWKTAYGALDRIRQQFGQKCPPLFFAGAAIENSMAEEIFNQLQNGLLTYAANLTVRGQVEDLVTWLVSL
jgi:type II restriction enzyme